MSEEINYQHCFLGTAVMTLAATKLLLSSETFRNAQSSAIVLNIIALMDALQIEKAILAGFDWGARMADIVAALWPDRCVS